MPARTYTYRQLLKRLRAHDKRFREYREKGKGSHRMISHPDINGQPASYPLVCHAEGDEIRVAYLLAIVRRFNLPRDFF